MSLFEPKHDTNTIGNINDVSCLIETSGTWQPNVSPIRHDSFIYFRSTTTDLSCDNRPWCFLEENKPYLAQGEQTLYSYHQLCI